MDRRLVTEFSFSSGSFTDFVNHLPGFTWVEIRLNKRIGIIGCFSRFNFSINLIRWPFVQGQTWGSLDFLFWKIAIAHTLPLVGCDPRYFFAWPNTFCYDWSMTAHNSQKFSFPISPQNVRVITQYRTNSVESSYESFASWPWLNLYISDL